MHELRPPPSNPGRKTTLQAQPALEIGRFLLRNVTDSLFTAQTWEPVLAMKPRRYRSIWTRASLNVYISNSYLLVKKNLKGHLCAEVLNGGRSSRDFSGDWSTPDPRSAPGLCMAGLELDQVRMRECMIRPHPGQWWQFGPRKVK